MFYFMLLSVSSTVNIFIQKNKCYQKQSERNCSELAFNSSCCSKIYNDFLIKTPFELSICTTGGTSVFISLWLCFICTYLL